MRKLELTLVLTSFVLVLMAHYELRRLRTCAKPPMGAESTHGSEGSDIVIHDSDGTVRIRIGVDDGQPVLEMFGRGGGSIRLGRTESHRFGVNLTGPDNEVAEFYAGAESGIWIWRPDKNPALSLLTTANDSSLTFWSGESVRAAFEFNRQLGAAIMGYGEEENHIDWLLGGLGHADRERRSQIGIAVKEKGELHLVRPN